MAGSVTVPGIVAGKRLLITGVLTEASIAFAVARLAQEQGASVVLTGFGRGLSITTRIAGRLPQPAPVLELDVTDADQLDQLASALEQRLGGGGGGVAAVGVAPPAAVRGDLM